MSKTTFGPGTNKTPMLEFRSVFFFARAETCVCSNNRQFRAHRTTKLRPPALLKGTLLRQSAFQYFKLMRIPIHTLEIH